MADDTIYPLVHALLGRYTIDLPLGRGGMGTVYQAEGLKNARDGLSWHLRALQADEKLGLVRTGETRRDLPLWKTTDHGMGGLC